MSKWTLEAFVAHTKSLRKADQLAIKILAKDIKARLANTNEWRNAFDDREKNFADKESTERRIKELETWKTEVASKQIGVAQLYGTAFAVVTATGVIFAIFKGG